MAPALWVPQGHPRPPEPMPFLPTRWQRRGSGGHLSLSLNSSAVLPAPYILQEVQVDIINTTMCNYLYEQPAFRLDIWGDMVCAGDPEGGKDACFVSVLPTPVRGFWAQHPTTWPQAREQPVPLYLVWSSWCPWELETIAPLQMQQLRLGCFQGRSGIFIWSA